MAEIIGENTNNGGKMNYFKIYESADEKVIGMSPQISNAIYPTTFDSSNTLAMLSFSKANSFTEIPKGTLNKKAHLSDLMSVSFFSGQLFISHKFYNILKIPPGKGVEFLKTSLIKGHEEFKDYWIVNPYLTDYSFIDCSKCEFVFTDSMGKIEFERVVFDSSKDFIEAHLRNREEAPIIGYPKFRPLVIKRIAFKDDSEFDFFSVLGVKPSGIGYYVSERLKKEIEKQGCTGIVFKEPNEIYP